MFKQQKSSPALDWVIIGSFLLFIVFVLVSIDHHDFISGLSKKCFGFQMRPYFYSYQAPTRYKNSGRHRSDGPPLIAM